MLLHVKVRLGKFLYGKICIKLDLAKKKEQHQDLESFYL